MLDGERIRINQVDNFQYADQDAINICFATTQGLHMDMWMAKENGMSFDDFDEQKVVLISDEAHHLNVDTKKKMSADEESSYHSWEQTVKNIFSRNVDNILLEFTATCDLANPAIRAAYENKIIFDYALAKFYGDRYSKDIITLRSDLTVMERALQALVLSQYRLKVFQDHRLGIKPVVLFKAAKIADSKDFMYNRIYLVRNEREFHIYSFEDGERFEPDYVLFLQKDRTDGFEQLQIFIEPKGTQLLEKDAWKEKCLLQLKTEAVPMTIFVDDNDYKIWGLHFFNQEYRMKDFDTEFSTLIN